MNFADKLEEIKREKQRKREEVEKERSCDDCVSKCHDTWCEDCDRYDSKPRFVPIVTIRNLRQQLKAEQDAHNALREKLKVVVNTFEKDIEQGYKTKDKEYVIDILSVALGVK